MANAPDYSSKQYKTNNKNYILNEHLDTNIVMDITQHKYILKDNPNIELTSVTGILCERLFDMFNIMECSSKHQSNLYKINHEIPKPKRFEAVIADWEFARIIGSHFHEVAETYITLKQTNINNNNLPMSSPSKKHKKHEIMDEIRSKIDDFTQSFDPSKLKAEWNSNQVKQFVIEEYNSAKLYEAVNIRANAFDNAFNLIFNKHQVAAVEHMIYDYEHKISGTVDALFWHNIERREVIIVDWKTCSTYTFYPSKIKNENSPFYGCAKSKLDKYYCQLHLYSKILTRNYNVNVVGSYVVFFNKDQTYALFYKPINETICKCTSFIFSD